MSFKNKDEAILALAQYIEAHKEADAYLKELNKVLQLEVENKFSEIIYQNLQAYGRLLETMIAGDHISEWISWYIWENKFGANQYEAGYKNNIRKICDVEDLYWLLTYEKNKK